MSNFVVVLNDQSGENATQRCLYFKEWPTSPEILREMLQMKIESDTKTATFNVFALPDALNVQDGNPCDVPSESLTKESYVGNLVYFPTYLKTTPYQKRLEIKGVRPMSDEATLPEDFLAEINEGIAVREKQAQNNGPYARFENHVRAIMAELVTRGIVTQLSPDKFKFNIPNECSTTRILVLQNAENQASTNWKEVVKASVDPYEPPGQLLDLTFVRDQKQQYLGQLLEYRFNPPEITIKDKNSPAYLRQVQDLQAYWASVADAFKKGNFDGAGITCNNQEFFNADTLSQENYVTRAQDLVWNCAMMSAMPEGITSENFIPKLVKAWRDHWDKKLATLMQEEVDSSAEEENQRAMQAVEREARDLAFFEQQVQNKLAADPSLSDEVARVLVLSEQEELRRQAAEERRQVEAQTEAPVDKLNEEEFPELDPNEVAAQADLLEQAKAKRLQKQQENKEREQRRAQREQGNLAAKATEMQQIVPDEFMQQRREFDFGEDLNDDRVREDIRKYNQTHGIPDNPPNAGQERRRPTRNTPQVFNNSNLNLSNNQPPAALSNDDIKKLCKDIATALRNRKWDIGRRHAFSFFSPFYDMPTGVRELVRYLEKTAKTLPKAKDGMTLEAQIKTRIDAICKGREETESKYRKDSTKLFYKNIQEVKNLADAETVAKGPAAPPVVPRNN